MSEAQKPNNELSLTKRALYKIARLQEALAQRQSQDPAERSVAIIGAGCRFPAGIDSLEGLWDFLMAGGDATGDIPAGRWDVEEWYSPRPDTPGKMVTRRGAFLDDITQFDAAFFGISPREANMMDPNQRLLLECGWEAMENAGYTRAQLAQAETGVYIAANFSEYLATLPPEALSEYAGTGNALSMAAGRLAYHLGVNAPAMVIDTACSSALVAIAQAVKQLRQRDINMALVGASSLYCSPAGFIMASRARMLSADGRCKTFSQRANGYARGEGTGVVLLKRLDDARRDGDRILAVINGVAVNQDGASGGLTVPSGPAQQAVIRKALADAELSPEHIGYIEAHGTGTPLGDPIELGALAQVFGQSHSAQDPLLIGSVKTNIGHLESAAGLAGLLKVIMALRAGQLPPHLHSQPLNSHVPWQRWPLKIADKITPWPERRAPLAAGVSSFGFSGTNAHIILSQAPCTADEPAAVDRPLHLLTLSARSEQSLHQLRQRYLSALTAETHECASLADICFTANAGREHFSCRLALIADDLPSLLKRLADPASVPIAPLKGAEPRIAWVFGPLTPEWLTLHEALFTAYPAYRTYAEQAEASFISRCGTSPLQCAQPLQRLTPEAQFILHYAFAHLLQLWGVEPEMAAGYGGGEAAAACLSGLLDLDGATALLSGKQEEVCFQSPNLVWASCSRRPLPPPEPNTLAYWRQRLANSADDNADFQSLRAADIDYAVCCDSLLQLVAIGANADIAPAESLPDWCGLIHLLRRLYLSGCGIDWALFDQPWPRRRVALPSMAFTRQRFWWDAAPAPQLPDGPEPTQSALLTSLKTQPNAVRKNLVIDFLHRQAGEALGVASAELDDTLALHSQGFDSLMALRLYHACRQHLALELPLEQIVAGESLKLLTEKVWQFMEQQHAWLAEQPCAAPDDDKKRENDESNG